MSLRRDVKEIKERSNKMYDLFSSYLGEAILTERKLKQAEEKLKYLDDVKLQVANVENKLDENGLPCLYVEYNAPVIKLRLDDNKNLINNPCFTAINMLDLISLDDMKKLSEALIEFKK